MLKMKRCLYKLMLAVLVMSTMNATAQSLIVNIETFNISAAVPEEVMQALASQTPKIPGSSDVALGWTLFKWTDVSIDAQQILGGCKLGAIRINGIVTTYHPKLINAKSMVWQNKFDIFAQDVRQHEHKHAQIYIRHWNAMQSELGKMNGVSFNKECNEIQALIQKRLAEWEQEVSQEHKLLDAAEGHIRTNDLRSSLGL